MKELNDPMMKHNSALPGPVFDVESPIRHLPRDLNFTQRRFLEGIRFGIEMTQLSHVRLRELLTEVSRKGTYPSERYPDQAANAFLDAWSMVDSIHRLRELLSAMPNVKKSLPPLEIFMRATSEIEPLRNHAQHLKGDLLDPTLGHLPVWGTLGWLWVVDTSLSHFISGVVAAGSYASELFPIHTPANRIYHDQLDHITLSIGVSQINLSEAMRKIVQLARALEKNIKPQLEGKVELAPVDMLMLLNIAMEHETDSTT
jgi:hypothetical protein